MKTDKGFVWYGLRISFWVMVSMWLMTSIMLMAALEISFIISILFLLSSCFCFILAILHLVKYDKKSLAIVSLILSSYVLSGIIYSMFEAI